MDEASRHTHAKGRRPDPAKVCERARLPPWVLPDSMCCTEHGSVAVLLGASVHHAPSVSRLGIPGFHPGGRGSLPLRSTNAGVVSVISTSAFQADRAGLSPATRSIYAVSSNGKTPVSYAVNLGSTPNTATISPQRSTAAHPSDVSLRP